jgi:hypothetical protein
MDLVAPLTQLASKDKLTEEESDGLREDYQKYLAAAKTLRATLSRIDHSTERHQEALKLVQATMGTTGDLWALYAAREELIAALHSRLFRSGLDFRDSGLNSALREIEGIAWRALLPLASQALNELWRNQLLPSWKTVNDRLNQQLASEEDRCKARTEFLRKDLGEFVTKSMAALYVGNSLQQCTLKHMAPPFERQLLVPDSICQKVRDARKVGDDITDCPKALGSGGNAPKRDVQRADVLPSIGKGCTFTADEVLFDRGDKVFACPQSTGICTESKERKSSLRALIRVKWQGQRDFTLIHERDSAEELFQLAQGSGSKTFPVPKAAAPGHCEGFRIRFDLAPAAPGSGAMPKAADLRWKTVDLPPSLL